VIWNLGFFFYGVDWLATNADFKMSSANVARRLDQFLPKSSSGGAVGVGLDVFLVASDVTGSIALRRELIKAGPRQLNDIMAEAQKAPAPGPSSASPAPPAPPRAAPRPASTPATPAAAGDGGFAFDPKMRALIDASPLDGMRLHRGPGMTERQAALFVQKMVAELRSEVGDYAALLAGPMAAIPPLTVVDIAERIHVRFHEIKESVEQ